MTPKVLLSYRHKHDEFVRRLDADLIAAGITAWVDYRDIKPGQPWRQAIYDGIVQSEVVIICFSPDFLLSEICLQEAYLARCYGKRIVPIMVEACYDEITQYEETKGLEDLFIIDFTGQPTMFTSGQYEDSFRRLLDALQRPTTTGQPPDPAYYVSFANQDNTFATQLAKDLQGAGVDVWISTLNLYGGQHWRDEVARVMVNACCLIVCLSPEAAQSDWVRREVLLARTRGIPMLPVVTPRVTQDQAVFQALHDVVFDTYEMRLLGEINWVFPRPDYAAMLSTLKQILTEGDAVGWDAVPEIA